MRADRLVATLLFLQARGRVTATEVASELEVSVKTARRDLEALSIAGIPVYSQAGRGGGWELIGGARTDLTGLTATEARTLFLVAGPASAVTPEAKAALRKLVRALPETFREEAEKAASAVVLDPAAWGGTPVRTPPHLEALQQSVIRGVQARIGYTDAKGNVSERTVHPLGLASKGTTWYLVADTDAGLRTFKVWRVQSVELTTEPARRPDGFDLHETWSTIVTSLESGRGARRVRALVDPEVFRWLRPQFGTRLHVDPDAPPRDDGRIAVELGFSSAHDDPARELCAYAGSLEVVEPVEVRDRLVELATQIIERHGGGAPIATPSSSAPR